MALQIEDAKAEEAAHKLAELRNVSLGEAVTAALQEALQRERRNLPVEQRLAKVWAMVDAMPATGEKADKAFFDQLWGEND